MSSRHWRAFIAPALLACILSYSALLRLDALSKAYGPHNEPRWLAAAERAAQPLAATITPDWRWRHIDTPYVGGDPINYLKFAREMQHFYAAHVREPMYPASVKLSLALTGDADVGVSIASIMFGLLALVAIYALGAQLASPAVGLAAAAALGIDRSAVGWSIGGWRDDLFACLAISCAWAWLRFAQRPSRGHAVVAGLLSAAACLTRITSLSFLVPAVVWVLATHPRSVRRHVALAAGICVALVSPFLISCAISTGDPLYAINHHVDFYLSREAAAANPPITDAPESGQVTAIDYSVDKFASRPWAATDNALLGVFVYPFANKWVGLDAWIPELGTLLACLAAIGLLSWLWHPDGRMLLTLFFAALVPFSMTWTVRGGAEWRLTLFAYGFYLIAAFGVVDALIRKARAPFMGTSQRPRLLPTAGVAAILLFAAVWAYAVPYAVTIEALSQGAHAIIAAGRRDRLFFADGWSGLQVNGNVVARESTDRLATLRLPLPEMRSYSLQLRLDPADTSRPQDVRIKLDERTLDDLELQWNPERVGDYEVVIPSSIVDPGMHRLTFESDSAFKLWYVRISPQ